MYPRERSLVSAMQGRPFVLLGVNSDRKERLVEAMRREKINWRSWWDGSTGGPIARLYRVKAWPTIFIIDHRGIIRHKQAGTAEFESVVERLTAEAEAASGR